MCLCLCAGERPVSVSMTPSRRKARELHHVSPCGSHVCVNVPVHVSWCVCACKCVHAGGHSCWGHCPFLPWGPQMLLRPLWTTFPPSLLQAPSRITSRVDQIGKAQRLPSSASILAFQGWRDCLPILWPWLTSTPEDSASVFHRSLSHVALSLSPVRAILHLPLHPVLSKYSGWTAAPAEGEGGREWWWLRPWVSRWTSEWMAWRE